MNFTSAISSEVKIPGIYAVIEENILQASKVTNLGNTPTVILDAPDFFYQPDESEENTIKPVRVQPNSLYVIDNPKELLDLITGDVFLEGMITENQLNSMRCPDLENALLIATQQNKSFAFVKMVKRDGTRPNMDNLYEVYEAHEYATESLSVMNVGTLVPFGFSVKDIFELGESEAVANVQINAGDYSSGTPYAGYTDKAFPNRYDLDIEKDFSGNISFKLTDAGVTNTNDVEDGLSAEIYYENAIGDKIAIANDVPVEYNPNFKFNDTHTSVQAIVLKENVTVEVEPGELTLVINAGTLVATVSVDGSGDFAKVDDKDIPTTLTTDGSGVLITNFDLSALPVTKDTVIGEQQNFNFVATTNKNPYTKIETINNGSVPSNIQVEQGINDLTGLKNYNPSIADTYMLNFKVSDTKNTTSVYAKLDDIENGVDPIAVDLEIEEKAPAGSKIYILKSQHTIKLIDGVNVILPAGLIVFLDGQSAVVGADNIFYDIAYKTQNQPVYKINSVPYKTRFSELYARFAHDLTFKLDETRVVLSSGLIPSDTASEKLKFIKALESLNLRGSFKNIVSPTKFYDLGKYISVPVGMAKSTTGVGGFKPSLTVKVRDFGRTNGGAGEIEALTTKIIINDVSSFRKGDKVELQTIKQLNVISEQNEIVGINKMTNGQYAITVKNAVDTKKFNKSAYDVTLALINKKDLKGNYTAFQYAMYSDDEDNKSLVRKYIPSIAECVFTKDMITRLNTAGYTVINYDPNSTYAFVENTPTMADVITNFTSQSTVGVLFYMLRKLRALGRNYQGLNLNLAQNQISYNEGLDNIKKELLDNGLVVTVTITPDFSKVASGKLSALINFKEGRTLEEIKYITLIDNNLA